MSLEQLSVLREAMEHYDWQAAFDGARDGSFADPVSEAERLDLLAEAAWWLGNLEDCISNREAAFAAWTAVGRPVDQASARCGSTNTTCSEPDPGSPRRGCAVPVWCSSHTPKPRSTGHCD